MTMKAKEFEVIVNKHSIRQQLKLNENELKRIIGCQIGRNEYIEILKAKGFL